MKQLTIDTSLIRSLNPCESRFDNYLAYYESFSGTLEQFLSLEHITYDDKVWVSANLMSKQQLVAWAAACAESVLDLFESEFPDDKRPRRAIEAAIAWAGNPSAANAAAARAAAAAARAAAYDAAYDAASYDAARAAAYAANAAADANAANAADAAAYAAYAATNAAAYAANANAARNRQQSLNLTLLLKVTQQQPT